MTKHNQSPQKTTGIFRRPPDSTKDYNSLRRTTKVSKRLTQSNKDSTMDPGSNTGNIFGNWGHSVDGALHSSPKPLPTSPPQDMEVDPLQAVQQRHQHLFTDWNNLKSEKNIWVKEREAFCCQMVKLKDENIRLKELLELKDNDFAAERKRKDDAIEFYDLLVSSLKKGLNFEMEQADAMQMRKIEETKKMAALLEAETQKVSKYHLEVLKLKIEQKKTVLLHNALQNTVKQLEQQLCEKDHEILNLQELNHKLSCRLHEANNALQEKPSEDLVLKEQSWERSTKLLEEEVASLKEEQVQKEEEEHVQKEEEEQVQEEEEEKKEEKDQKQKDEEAKPQVSKKDLKKKAKEEKKVMKEKEMEEKKQRKEKEKEEKKQIKEKEKDEKKKLKEEKKKLKQNEPKGFWSWFHRRKKCDGNTEVEEAAGCLSQQ